jgi:hypothetical protein
MSCGGKKVTEMWNDVKDFALIFLAQKLIQIDKKYQVPYDLTNH